MTAETYFILGVVAVILFASRPTIIVTGGNNAPHPNSYTNPFQFLTPLLILVFLGVGGFLVWHFSHQNEPAQGAIQPSVQEESAPIEYDDTEKAVNSNPHLKHPQVEQGSETLPVSGSTRQNVLDDAPSPQATIPVVLLREYRLDEESKAKHLGDNFPQRSIKLHYVGNGTNWSIWAVIMAADLAEAKAELADLNRHLADLRDAGCPEPRIAYLPR